jgi:hypothetical protein
MIEQFRDSEKSGTACLMTFDADRARKGPPGEGASPPIGGEGRIGEVLTV